ncbi:hypothetical protein N9Z15_04925 [Akkermansiaceae bacterium]|nr:hypothetical protein [Akkermansiaceae bacterium]
MKNKLMGVGVSTLALLTLPSQAVFTLLDDFESYTAGTNVNGVGGWTADPDQISVFATDPSDAGNTVLSTTRDTNTSSVFKTMPTIADGTTGTVFFRARATDFADFVLGTSDVADPTGNWNNYEGYMRFNKVNVGDPNNIDVRDGGGFANVGTYNADEWYNVWLVLDHTLDVTTVYINQGNGDATTAAGSGAFRATAQNTVHDDLINLFIRGNNAGNAGLVDDIYVDTAGANLSNPAAIPEPATSLLALVGLAFGMHRRRS